MNKQSERDILLRLQHSSPEAFEKLFHKYGGKLYNFILKLSSGDTYLAEEIVQRTFVRVWEMRSTINPKKTFISYLCTIAKNILLNEYKRQTVEYIYRNYIINFHLDSDYSMEETVDKNLLEEYIDRLVENLPPARRQIFILSRKGMLSNKEIAEYLQISESTVYTQMSKAISFMKEHLSKYYNTILLILLMSAFVN